MEKTVKRHIKIRCCDLCGEESEHINKCSICKRELCISDKGEQHVSHSVDIFRYSDHKRLSGHGRHVCEECTNKKFTGTIGDLLNGMMDRSTVVVTHD